MVFGIQYFKIWITWQDSDEVRSFHRRRNLVNFSVGHTQPEFLTTGLEGRDFTGCGKTPAADNHPGAQGATSPESGGELAQELPSSDEEGWRAERRGGLSLALRGGLTRGGVGNVNAEEFFRSLFSPALPRASRNAQS
jgi:hypothetical protein